jgi:hypothetical protein
MSHMPDEPIEPDDADSFELDGESQLELLEAMAEIERGEFVTKEQVLAELKQLKQGRVAQDLEAGAEGYPRRRQI